MNNNVQYLGEVGSLPGWFEYPVEFRVLVDQGLVRFVPWYLVDVVFASKVYARFQSRYGRELFPIAHRDGSDEVACVEKGAGGKIKIINGNTSSGHEVEAEFRSFWEWFRFAIEEMIEHSQ
jgi:hypothetical protein